MKQASGLATRVRPTGALPPAARVFQDRKPPYGPLMMEFFWAWLKWVSG